MLSAADAACYAAKDQGRNRVHVYSANDAALGMHGERTRCLQHIHSALERNGFELHSQSIVPVKHGNERGRRGELLLRLPVRTEKGAPESIPPGGFLPTAERFQLLPRIDRWVVRRVLHEMGRADGALADAELCANQHLARVLRRFALRGGSAGGWLRDAAVDPRRLCFEISESAVEVNPEKAIAFICRLRTVGCKFALDNFGAGTNTLVLLSRLPIDYVKLDGLLTRDLAQAAQLARRGRRHQSRGPFPRHADRGRMGRGCRFMSLLRELRIDHAQGFGLEWPRLRVHTAAPGGACTALGPRLVGESLEHCREQGVGGRVGIRGEFPAHHSAQRHRLHIANLRAQRVLVLVADEVPAEAIRVVGIGCLRLVVPVPHVGARAEQREDFPVVVDAGAAGAALAGAGRGDGRRARWCRPPFAAGTFCQARP